MDMGAALSLNGSSSSAVADWTATVSRLLECGGAGIRGWLRAALLHSQSHKGPPDPGGDSGSAGDGPTEEHLPSRRVDAKAAAFPATGPRIPGGTETGTAAPQNDSAASTQLLFERVELDPLEEDTDADCRVAASSNAGSTSNGGGGGGGGGDDSCSPAASHALQPGGRGSAVAAWAAIDDMLQWDVSPPGLAGAARTPLPSRNVVHLAPPPVRRNPAAAASGAAAASSSSAGSSGGGSAGAAHGMPAADAVAAPATAAAAAPRLTTALSRAADWRQLAALLAEQEPQALDAIHASAALVRLAKLHRADPAALLLIPAAGSSSNDSTGSDGVLTDVGPLATAPEALPPAAASAASAASAAASAASAAASAAAGSPASAAHPGAGRRWAATGMGQRENGMEDGPCRAGARQWQRRRRRAAEGGGAASVVGTPAASPAGIENRHHPGLHPEVAALVVRLLGRLPALMPRAGPRTVSNILWALGVLQPLLAPRRPAPPGAASLPPAAATHAAAMAAATLLAAKMRHFWRELEPPSLALSLWGMGRLGLRPGPVWVAGFEAASMPLLPRLSARELSYSMWALAALRLRPDAMWLTAACRAMAAAVTRRPPRRVGGAAVAPVNSVGGAAVAPAGAGAAMDADADTGPTVQTLATMLWACVVLSVRLEEPVEAALMSALTAQLRREGARAGSQALAMALWGCARLGCRPSQQTLAAWREAASGPALAAAPARAVSAMLWALARLRAAPPGAWVAEAADALLARAREGLLGRQALCNALGSLAQLDSRLSPEWLHAFTAAAAPLLRELDSRELGVVLHSLGRLTGGSDGDGGGAPRARVAAEFLAAADAAAAVALAAASADDLAGIGGGLAALSDGAAVSVSLRVAFVRQAARLITRGSLHLEHAATCLSAIAAFHAPQRRPATSHTSGDSGRPTGIGAAEHAACDTRAPLTAAAALTPPERRLVMALVRLLLTSDLDEHDVYDVGAALAAAAALGYVPVSPAARGAVATAAVSVCRRKPGARPVLRLLHALYALRIRPSRSWLRYVAAEAGGRLRALKGEELESLLRLVGFLQQQPLAHAAPAPADAKTRATASHGAQQQQQQQQQQEGPSPLVALLASAQASLASAPIQHLLDLAGALIAAATDTTAADAGAGQLRSSLPAPPPLASLPMPDGWLAAFERASAPKLSERCVSAAALVELLACLACLGHTPGPAWAAAWHAATAPRLATLRPQHLLMALHLQRRAGMAPPPAAWLQSHAAALAAAVEGRLLAPVEALAAVAELQRFGLSDASAGAVAPTLSGLATAAAAALHEELVAAEPARQLATLAALQGVAGDPIDPRVGPAPASEGWAVGVMAMAHSVITQRPLYQLLAALHLPPPPPADSDGDDDEGQGLDAAAEGDDEAAGVAPAVPVSVPVPVPGSSALVLLMASLVRWGHNPGERWLSGVAHHLCRQADSPHVCWPAADLARAVVCLAALGYVPAADVAARLQQRLLLPLAAAELPACLAAELCWAWAAARRPPPPAWWRGAEGGALAPTALPAVPPFALVRLPWSMAAAGHAPSYEWLVSYLSLLPAVLAALPDDVFAPPPQPQPSMDADTSEVTRSSCGGGGSARRAEELAGLAWGLGRAVHEGGHPPALLSATGALPALLAASGRCLGALGPDGAVLMLEGLARCRHRLPGDWLGLLMGRVAVLLPACGPAHMVSILHCLALLDVRSPAGWLAAALQRADQLMPSLLLSEAPQRINDLGWAVATLDPAGGLAAPFLERLARRRAALHAAAANGSGGDAAQGDGGDGSAAGTPHRRPGCGGGGRAVMGVADAAVEAAAVEGPAADLAKGRRAALRVARGGRLRLLLSRGS